MRSNEPLHNAMTTTTTEEKTAGTGTGVFEVINTLEKIKRAEAKRKREQRVMFKRIAYGLSIAFIIAAAVFVQVYYHPVTVVEVIHTAYTLKHAIASDEENIPTYPVLLETDRKFQFPSNELQAFDSMLRVRPVVARPISEEMNFKQFREEQRDAIASMFESASVPKDDQAKTFVPGGEKGRWVTWEGVDNSTAAPTILYLHGGIGRFVGSARAYLGFLHELSLASGYRVFGADYGLAPHTTITEAVQDALQAYQFLHEDMGVPASQIFIAGDSSGGLVALLLAQAIRDNSLPAPCGVWAMSPQTDLTGSAESIDRNRGRDAVFVRLADTYKEWVWLTAGVTNELPLDDPRLSPLFADWTGLPPLMFSVGESEILLDDSLRAARKARSQGVSVTLDLQAHVPHAFPVFVNYAPEFDTAFGRGVGFIAEQMGQNEFIFQ